MHCFTRLLAILSWLALSAAHTQIVYPGERGDNLHTNGTLPQNNPNTIGVDISPDGSWEFPYGQQFIYPCTSFLTPLFNTSLTPIPQAAACPSPATAPSGPT